MVVRVRQAMIVPHSVQGGANGCKVASHLRTRRDYSLQPAAMDKLKGGIENGRQGGHETLGTWHRAASESSLSSMDSFAAGEAAFPQAEAPPPPHSYDRKAKLGVLVSESDDESMLDSLQDDFTNKKSRRPFIGNTVSSHPAAPLSIDEGDPKAGLVVTSRDFPVYFEGGKRFGVPISPTWLASARKVSFGLDEHYESCGSDDGTLSPRGHHALPNSYDGVPSCKAPSAVGSFPVLKCRSESHSTSCYVGMGSVGADHGSTPSDDGKDSSSRVKFMCSFGGKIFPRPSDGKLRYVGGDTRIVAINRDTNFHDLMLKMRDLYGQKPILKYQLPDEDLDALVSVSTHEDLQNMMEEYDKFDRADKSSRLRVFLFPALDYDSSFQRKDSTGDLRNSEQRYVDAVNGISEVGSRSRVESYTGGPSAFSGDNLISLDVPDSWSFPLRGQDPVPVANVAPPIAHEVASHILRGPVAVPVSAVLSRPNAPSAPSSAPSSPPLLPRQNLAKLPPVLSDHLQYHPDAHVKVGSQYNVLAADGNYQDQESYGGTGTSSGPAQLEPLYRSSETRRGPDSPPRKQHEVVHQDHHVRPEQRRISDAKVPRVGSHGKLSRMAEHVEIAPSAGETQQIPEGLEIQRRIHQQQSSHQGGWQNPKDPSQDNYRRHDLHQSGISQNTVLGTQQQGYQQQLQPLAFRAGIPQGALSHDPGYRHGDQQQQYAEEVPQHMPRSVSSLAVAPVSGQSSGYHVGSAPSSPRLGFSSRHAQGPQQVPLHWAFGGSTFAEQPSFGRRKNYGDQPGRSFRQSNSPPKYRDRVGHSDERLLRQQQQQSFGNPESVHLEQVPKSGQATYEANPTAQPFDLLSRHQVPTYKGHNPFQEKLLPYQDHHQDSGEGRRHQLPQQGMDSQFITGQQPHVPTPHQHQRHEFHDPGLQQVEQLSGNPRYPEPRLKVSEWESEDGRLGFRGRVRTGALEDEVSSDSSHQREVPPAAYAGLHLPETSDDLISGPVTDFPAVHGQNDRLDRSGTSGFQFRTGVPQPGPHAGYSGPIKSRTNQSDTVGVPRYIISRKDEPDYFTAGRTGAVVQDPRSSVFDHQHTSGLVQGFQLPPGSYRLEDRQGATFNSISQQHLKNLRNSDNPMSGSDIRWNGGLGPDDVRIETPTQGHVLDSFYEERPQGLPNLTVSRGTSRLSRPSSSTNIPALLEEERGDRPPLHPYVLQGRNNNLMDEDPPHQYIGKGIPPSDSVLYNSNALRYTSPSPNIGPAPATSSGLFGFDPTPINSSSSEYLPSANLPSIKTTGTQVPSAEEDDDQSGGSTSTIGGSDHTLSISNKGGSGELFSGQLEMTQHLAEDMASCVLEPNATKAGSTAGVALDERIPSQGPEMWPAEPAPSASPNLWENALDDAVETKREFVDRTCPVEADQLQEVAEAATSSIKDEDSKKVEISIGGDRETQSDVMPFKNAADAAADDAVAHGLQTIKNDDLEELRELGSGTFGTVYHGKWRGTDVAIKRIKASCFAGRPSEQERLIADFWREACNLGNLHHPNVVAFYGVVSDGPGGTLATVTEYMVNGSLKQVLQKKDRTIDRRKRLSIAMDSAFGMEYLHGKNIVHFDLKCENLLVNMRDPHRPICKVGDLGLSKVKHQTMVSGGVRGTLPWMAPELLTGSSSLVTEKVDVFSFGIVMWELLTGEEPYANMHYGAIIGGIVNNTLRPVIPTWCDPGWRSLMERCWSSEPASRPSFSEVASELRGMSESLRPKA